MRLEKLIFGHKISMDNLSISGIIDQSLKDHQSTISYVESNDFNVKFSDSLKMIFNSIQNQGCIFTCGNGGSFSDAQHFTAELVVRYKRDREPLSSITLGCNLSNISACSNDYSYEYIFERDYKAISKKEDTLIALSTSGNSPNIRKVLNFANEKKRNWILLTSDKIKNEPKGGIVIKFPFLTTASVQEAHIFTLHLLCRSLDDLILGNENS